MGLWGSQVAAEPAWGAPAPRGSASSTHHPSAEHWCLCVADVPCLGGGTGAASRALGAAPAAWGLCGTAWTSPCGSDHAQAPAASSECPPTRVPPPPALPAPCGQGGGGQARARFAMGGCQRGVRASHGPSRARRVTSTSQIPLRCDFP